MSDDNNFFVWRLYGPSGADVYVGFLDGEMGWDGHDDCRRDLAVWMQEGGVRPMLIGLDPMEATRTWGQDSFDGLVNFSHVWAAEFIERV